MAYAPSRARMSASGPIGATDHYDQRLTTARAATGEILSRRIPTANMDNRDCPQSSSSPPPAASSSQLTRFAGKRYGRCCQPTQCPWISGSCEVASIRLSRLETGVYASGVTNAVTVPHATPAARLRPCWLGSSWCLGAMELKCVARRYVTAVAPLKGQPSRSARAVRRQPGRRVDGRGPRGDSANRGRSGARCHALTGSARCRTER